MKQEGCSITASGRSQWSSHKNPRIVRVSRSFGGKDRHSKVCTVRGLRDRRIRLSVPTAIQLYDLQDKLGLSQPSKVVDWLLDATKNDIDKLPPLPIIPGLPTFSQPQDQQEEGFGGFVAQNLFPLPTNQSSFPTYNPYSFHWDHPNLSLYPTLPPHQDQSHNTTNHLLPASTSQLFLPPIIPSFPSYITTPSMESINHVPQNPLFSTALHLTSPMKSTLNSKSLHPHQNHDAGRSGN